MLRLNSPKTLLIAAALSAVGLSQTTIADLITSAGVNEYTINHPVI